MPCARPSPSVARRARRSTTWPVRPGSRAGSCTTTSVPRSSSLVEVVRRDSGHPARAALDAAIASAHTGDDLLAALVSSLEDLVERDPSFVALHFELFTSARRTPEIAAELAALHRRIREHVAEAARGEGARGRDRADRRRGVGRDRAALGSPTASRCGCSPTPATTGVPRSPPRCRPRGRSSASRLPLRASDRCAGRPCGCASASVRGRGGLRACARESPLRPPVARSRRGAERAARRGRVLLRSAGPRGRRRLRPGCGL